MDDKVTSPGALVWPARAAALPETLQKPEVEAPESDVAEASQAAPDPPAAELERQSSQPSLFDPGAPRIAEKHTDGSVMPTYHDVVLTPEDEAAAAERWPDVSEKMRLHYMRQSILAKLRHQFAAQDGTGRRIFGGPQPGAGRKKAALGNSLVDEAANRQREIMDAVFAPLSPNGNTAIDRHKAAINIIREVRKDREVDMRADELERASREDLIKQTSEILAEMVRNGDISLDDTGQIVDAEAVDA